VNQWQPKSGATYGDSNFWKTKNTYFFNARGGIPLFYGKNFATEALTARKICNASQTLSVSTFFEETTHKQILMLKISLKFKRSKT
jgi:hypothetical protein